jgi:hypothetical protein
MQPSEKFEKDRAPSLYHSQNSVAGQNNYAIRLKLVRQNIEKTFSKWGPNEPTPPIPEEGKKGSDIA